MPAIPSEKECSALALDVYRDADRPPLPEGYQLLCDCPKELQHDDYFGAAYYVVIDDRSVSVVIAHRGTKINFGNLIDDLLLALEIAPEAYELSSKPFTEYVINQANEKFPRGTRLSYVFTGHSLGSIHAELCMASKCELDEFSAITFESPGSKPIISELVSKGQLPKDALQKTQFAVMTCNADVDAINTCNEQICAVPRFCPVGYTFGESQLLPVDETYYILDFTLDQHSMLKMYKYWTYGPPLTATCESDSWPVGLSAGYKYYRDYDSHSGYWDAALKSYWDNNPSVQDQYNGDYQAYIEYMMKTYFPDVPPVIAKQPTGKILAQQPHSVADTDESSTDLTCCFGLFGCSFGSSSEQAALLQFDVSVKL